MQVILKGNHSEDNENIELLLFQQEKHWSMFIILAFLKSTVNLSGQYCIHLEKLLSILSSIENSITIPRLKVELFMHNQVH